MSFICPINLSLPKYHDIIVLKTSSINDYTISRGKLKSIDITKPDYRFKWECRSLSSSMPVVTVSETRTYIPIRTFDLSAEIWDMKDEFINESELLVIVDGIAYGLINPIFITSMVGNAGVLSPFIPEYGFTFQFTERMPVAKKLIIT